MLSYSEAAGSFPKLQMNRAWLGNELVECSGLLLRPGYGEVIQIMIANRRFLCLALADSSNSSMTALFTLVFFCLPRSWRTVMNNVR